MQSCITLLVKENKNNYVYLPNLVNERLAKLLGGCHVISIQLVAISDGDIWYVEVFEPVIFHFSNTCACDFHG